VGHAGNKIDEVWQQISRRGVIGTGRKFCRWLEGGLVYPTIQIADITILNKKHLKNVGPIHHCEPPHAHSPDVASGTVARRLRIDVHDNADDNDNDNA